MILLEYHVSPFRQTDTCNMKRNLLLWIWIVLFVNEIVIILIFLIIDLKTFDVKKNDTKKKHLLWKINHNALFLKFLLLYRILAGVTNLTKHRSFNYYLKQNLLNFNYLTFYKIAKMMLPLTYLSGFNNQKSIRRH